MQAALQKSFTDLNGLLSDSIEQTWKDTEAKVDQRMAKVEKQQAEQQKQLSEHDQRLLAVERELQELRASRTQHATDIGTLKSA
eukprot:10384102-Karenia_brevis.AAC.1